MYWSVCSCREEPDKLWTLVTGLLPKWAREKGAKAHQEMSPVASVKSTPNASSSHATKNAGERERERQRMSVCEFPPLPTVLSSPLASCEVIMMANSLFFPRNGCINLPFKISRENVSLKGGSDRGCSVFRQPFHLLPVSLPLLSGKAATGSAADWLGTSRPSAISDPHSVAG